MLEPVVAVSVSVVGEDSVVGLAVEADSVGEVGSVPELVLHSVVG